MKCPVCGAEDMACTGVLSLTFPPLDLATPDPPTPPTPEQQAAHDERMARIEEEVRARRLAMGAAE